ncbi:hypothetical protein H2200_013112 [Cladophialophora chaetospira]|uniref:Transcription factor domain-containing protein n=1 Tax=Cladophialophora chaetospira TaxID=386627 RepID=A0AA39CBE6_9EURO|nr:hypothetical protein H2200_013112 [Cladophialophora chaetospira]
MTYLWVNKTDASDQSSASRRAVRKFVQRRRLRKIIAERRSGPFLTMKNYAGPEELQLTMPFGGAQTERQGPDPEAPKNTGSIIVFDSGQGLTKDIPSTNHTPSAYNRTIDWNFGALGAPCRRLTELDNAVLDHFLERRSERCGAGDNFALDASSNRDTAQVSKGLLRHAMYSASLLDSLIAFTVLNMIDGHPRAHDLKTWGERRAEVALREIRQALAVSDPARSPFLAFSILYLCMGCVFNGRVDEARVHLQYLALLARNMSEMGPYKQRFLYHLRCCDVRYAVQAGQIPIVPGDLVNEQWLGLSFSTETTSHINIEARSHGRHSSIAGHFDGFDAAMELGLLPYSMRHIFRQYVRTIETYDRLTKKTELGLLEMTSFRKQSLDCIEKLCGHWLRIHQPHLTDEKKTSDSASAGILEHVVHIAMQIHILVCVGRTSGQAIDVLSRRLRNYLTRDIVFHHDLNRELGDGSSQLRTRLLLWVLTVGMLAKMTGIDFDWFRGHAINLCRRLKLHTETDLLEVLSLFGPHVHLLSGDIVDLVAQSQVTGTAQDSGDEM